MDTTVFLGIPLKRELDIGHLLTAFTLAAGFLWWLYTTIREMRRKSRKEAESGALRLLLWVLRQREGQPVSLDELQREYNSTNLRDRRRAYCKKDFLLRTQERFEAAIYALDWEGKIDFVGPHAIAFRVDKDLEDIQEDQEQRQRRRKQRFEPSPADRATILALLKSSLWDKDCDHWKLRDLAESAMRFSPDDTSTLLRTALQDGDGDIQLKAASIMAQLSDKGY